MWVKHIVTDNYNIFCEVIFGDVIISWIRNGAYESIKDNKDIDYESQFNSFVIMPETINEFIMNGFKMNNVETHVTFKLPYNDVIHNEFSDIKSGICQLLRNYQNRNNVVPNIKYVGAKIKGHKKRSK